MQRYSNKLVQSIDIGTAHPDVGACFKVHHYYRVDFLTTADAVPSASTYAVHTANHEYAMHNRVSKMPSNEVISLLYGIQVRSWRLCKRRHINPDHPKSPTQLVLQFYCQCVHAFAAPSCTFSDCLLIRETSKLTLTPWQRRTVFPTSFIPGSMPEKSFGYLTHISRWRGNSD